MFQRLLSRWWDVCVQQDSVGNSVGELQMRVGDSRVSEGCRASRRLGPASSPVESVPITQSRREKRATSAFSMVRLSVRLSHIWELKIQRPTPATIMSPTPVCFLLSDMCSPPFPFPCHKDASCYSTKQSYSCTCKPGFTGNGHNCTGLALRRDQQPV